MMENVIEIESLRKEYKDFTLNDISFNVPKGYITGLIGPNGAGKTTIIKLIMNIIRRQAGTISVFGLDNAEHEAEVKNRIGFVHDVPSFYGNESLEAFAVLVGSYYSGWNQEKFYNHLRNFELEAKKKFKTLSKGSRMKFAIALALSHDADLIIMDEPTAGLDPIFRRELIEMLAEILQNENKSVLFSTHITSDLDRVADFLVYISDGTVEFSMSKVSLQENWAIIKSARDFITPDNRSLFKGWRTHAHGCEALTDNVGLARKQLPPDVVIERPALEDLMYLMNRR